MDYNHKDLFQQGISLMKEGNYEEARKMFEMAREEYVNANDYRLKN